DEAKPTLPQVATVAQAADPSEHEAKDPPSGKVDFTKDVAPILQEHCIRCHGTEKKPKGKLNLATKAAAMKGGESGACIVPGQCDKSTFYTMLIETDPNKDKMPPLTEKNQPSKQQIEILRKWIEQGADWPDSLVLKSKGTD